MLFKVLFMGSPTCCRKSAFDTVATAPVFFLGVVGLLALAACGPPRGDAEAGRRWYAMAHCDTCHGEDGHGGRGRPPALAGLQLGYGQFQGKIRQAGDGIMPSTGPEVLSDQRLVDMYLFLRQEKAGAAGSR